ncbi:hypothetical protein FPV67DRAFT_1445690 [Lyophyllum atratum]|nr:hypothetical protein FPV67DRAFT_1445690 [Lyophyllum atratum]
MTPEMRTICVNIAQHKLNSSPLATSSPDPRYYQESQLPSSPLSSFPAVAAPLGGPTGSLYIRSSESIKSASSPSRHSTRRAESNGLHSTRRKISAEEATADTCLYENDILMRVVESGRGGFGIIDAVALAQAARDSLIAEAHTSVTDIEECELKLEILRDSVEEAQARVEEANQQVDMLMKIIDSAGINIPAAYRQSSSSSSTLLTPLSNTKDVKLTEQLEETHDGSTSYEHSLGAQEQGVLFGDDMFWAFILPRIFVFNISYYALNSGRDGSSLEFSTVRMILECGIETKLAPLREMRIDCTGLRLRHPFNVGAG